MPHLGKLPGAAPVVAGRTSLGTFQRMSRAAQKSTGLLESEARQVESFLQHWLPLWLWTNCSFQRFNFFPFLMEESTTHLPGCHESWERVMCPSAWQLSRLLQQGSALLTAYPLKLPLERTVKTQSETLPERALPSPSPDAERDGSLLPASHGHLKLRLTQQQRAWLRHLQNCPR